MPESTLKDLYESQTARREPYWQRARDASSLTIPHLFPELGATGHTNFPDPFQSVGAGGLASMTSKLLTALFPPGLRFFAIDIDPKLVAEVESKEALAEFEAQRDLREQIIQYAIEDAGFRVRMAEAIKLLLVSGNCAIQRTKSKRWRIWRLPQYVADVSGEDDLLYVVTKEAIPVLLLKEETRRLEPVARALAAKKDPLDLYTVWQRQDDGRYQTYQEIEGARLSGTDASFTREQLPIQVCRFEPVCGEPYGRALVDRVYGDLASLEGLQQSIVELGAACSFLIWGIKPNSVVRPSDLEGAPNGSYRTMNPEDVFPLRVDKITDLTSVSRVAEMIRSDIQQQLGMRVSVQRDAERVTAYEIAAMAQDLDATLGGTYSAMTEELQLPILRMVEAELIRANQLTAVEGRPITTRIIAGMEGLGRAIELDQTRKFLALVAGVPQEAATGYEIDNRAVYERLARACGIDPATLLRDRAEVAAIRQQAAQQAQMKALGPEALRQGGELIRGAMNGAA